MAELDRRQFLGASAALVSGGVVGVGLTAPDADAATVMDAAEAGASATGHELGTGWTYLAARGSGATGAQLSRGATVRGLRPAVVPGTPLTSMLAAGDYPDPLYRHIVTDTVPDTLKDTDYWYRTRFTVPRLAAGQRFWLHLDGVNYTAEVWVEGTKVGRMQGAFERGVFDVTDVVRPGRSAWLAVRVGKLDYSEGPALPSYTSGVTRGGRNGGPTGITLANGPTFFCTAGWDWLPTIPDRDLGIWRPVRWSTTGAVRIADVFVDPTVSADLRKADVALELGLVSTAHSAQRVTVSGELGDRRFSHHVTVRPGASTVRLTSAQVPELRMTRPRLWWPNGHGEPYLYRATVRVEVERRVSDVRSVRFGVRRIEYAVPRTDPDGKRIDTLAVTVNNRRMMVMGGNWGLDEALKRVPRDRLFEQVRLHRDANLNLIRNWNGQSSSEDFYEACDENGILVWQDFFSSTEGPQPADTARDVANIRDCILRFRHHACVLLWCGGNEGPPKQELVDALDDLVAELDPKRLCLTSSAGDTGDHAVNGYSSGGPYHWVSPADHFGLNDATQWPPFRNEVGSYSIPTLEFIEKMIPPSSWEHPDDFWADRDVNGNGGNGGGSGYIDLTAQRYGEIRNLPDFARKSQLMNYECIRAIYEARVARMLRVEPNRPYPPTGVIMWMTHPAQPSFVWQMYSHDLETHASYYAVKHACRPLNPVLDAVTNEVAVGNHTADEVHGTLTAECYDLSGHRFANRVWQVAVGAADHARPGTLADVLASAPDEVSFVRLTMRGHKTHGSPGTLASAVTSTYWIERTGTTPGMRSLESMPAATITVEATARRSGRGDLGVDVRVTNTGAGVALMLHLQAYDLRTGERILPATFSENYLSLVPGETFETTVDIDAECLPRHGGLGVRVDGWKLDTRASRLRGRGVDVTFNEHALDVDPAAVTFNQG